MKKFKLVTGTLFFISLPFLTFAQSVIQDNKVKDVNVALKDGTIRLTYQQGYHSNICFLKTDELTLVAPRKINGTVLIGAISITSSVEAGTPCLTSFGPHRGLVVLNVGKWLPSITAGEHEVVINGQEVGLLTVESETSANFVSSNMLEN